MSERITVRAIPKTEGFRTTGKILWQIMLDDILIALLSDGDVQLRLVVLVIVELGGMTGVTEINVEGPPEHVEKLRRMATSPGIFMGNVQMKRIM